MWTVQNRVQLYFSACKYPISQASFIEGLSFPCSVMLVSLSNISWLHTWRGSCWPLILFHWSICQFLWQYHSVLITIAMRFSLKSGSVVPWKRSRQAMCLLPSPNLFFGGLVCVSVVHLFLFGGLLCFALFSAPTKYWNLSSGNVDFYQDSFIHLCVSAQDSTFQVPPQPH